jgi:hypothetical protein
MSMLAVIAAKEAAAIASGLGTTLMPAVGASTLDGFAAGMLLSGGVFLLLMLQRHGPPRVVRAVRPWRQVGAVSFTGRVLGHYRGSQRQVKLADSAGGGAEDEFLLGLPQPPGTELADEPGTAGAPGQGRRPAGYRSKHRLVGPEDSRPWPENHHRAPRHAAPSSALVSALDRMAGLMQLKLLGASGD